MALTRDQLVRDIQRLGVVAANNRTYRLEPGKYAYPKGGNGFVLWAKDAAGGLFAIKFFFRSREKPIDRERFLTEILVLKKLQHPRIVKCVGSGQLKIAGKAFPFYIMLRASGSMRDLINKRNELRSDLNFTCRFFVELAHALDHLHARGLFHRDIKEDNVLLDDQNMPILADVGIAHVPPNVISRAYKSGDGGENLRNVIYSTPEQHVETDRVDYRTDIASFGYLLNHWLTGEPARPNPRLPSDVLQRQDAIAIDAVIEGCIAREPKARYDAMSDCIEDLRVAFGERGQAKEQLGAFGSARRRVSALSRSWPQFELISQNALLQLYPLRRRFKPDGKEENLLFYSCVAGRGPGWTWIRTLDAAKVASLSREGLNNTFDREAYGGCLRVLGKVGEPGDVQLAKRFIGYPSYIGLAATEAINELVGRAAVSDLRALADDDHAAVRRVSLNRLVDIADPSSLQRWKDSLPNADPGIWDVIAAKRLWQLAPAETLEETRSWARRSCESCSEHMVPNDVPVLAIQVLGEIGNAEQDLPLLKRLLGLFSDRPNHSHASVNVVHAIVNLLQSTSPRGNLDFLLHHANSDTRSHALGALARLEPASRPEALRAFLDDPDDFLRGDAIEALGPELLKSLAIDRIRALAGEREDKIRRAIARSLGGTELPEAAEILWSLLADEDIGVQYTAAESLGSMFRDGHMSFEQIRQLAADARGFVRSAAARALSHAADARSMALLRQLLRSDESADVVESALAAIGNIGGGSDVELVAPYLDPNTITGGVRRAAEEALRKILHRLDEVGLGELLDHPAPRVRLYAIETAEQRSGTLCVGVLRPMLSDTDLRTRLAATRALGRVAEEDDLRELAQSARLDTPIGMCMFVALSIADERLYCSIPQFTNEPVLLDQLRLALLHKPFSDSTSF
ncbi:HEAT repeat domain-containing protein [Bradyrhizobium guangzhouense]|uniref:HEAT repeat domain-containing protein n=1 Tax=Bradyrhizobium guangzhouense TaxID=1325095 RepID=UPI0013E8CEC2|nr:HEAT repeat domain-containing protein [Bradyrhizobium guangzhouense]